MTVDIPLSFATCSIGKPTDSLPAKLQALSEAGFHAVELAFPDILTFAKETRGEVAEDDYEALREVARDIKGVCDRYQIKVMMLQPFANFEGWPRDSKEREDAFKRARGWISLMEALDCDMLQVGSTDTPTESLSPSLRESMIEDLQSLADLLSEKKMRLAYENWCWSSHAPDWSAVHDLITAVNRPNIGLCLDTFQAAGAEYADPTQPDGLIATTDAKSNLSAADKFRASMTRLAKAVPADKIYLLQVSDAYRTDPPLEDVAVDGMRPRARWSHDFRPLPYGGGYLPIEEVGRAVLGTGFRGWFSVEVFDGERRGVPLGEYAKQGMESVTRFVQRCQGDS
ncbi:sugar phosphate isomerase/epimerase family protein [Aspergillus homomorphus CBS 101889]|uniref:Putative 3-dehydroshikimate dehydratase n=1 Tax=Aspergillus homomorphus (strain CBS 101889) TaxID=1450537 RepID=A0A395IBH8_ASPHC|nr:putative 3-dehydroshikimate dehydratase [Aspergillus homomorphus CBS 101889]RAL17325.1 putative 3-dehydroshikimate dehydratase [Aspergillus homomorphus CBS 101889]